MKFEKKWLFISSLLGFGIPPAPPLRFFSMPLIHSSMEVRDLCRHQIDPFACSPLTDLLCRSCRCLSSLALKGICPLATMRLHLPCSPRWFQGLCILISGLLVSKRLVLHCRFISIAIQFFNRCNWLNLPVHSVGFPMLHNCSPLEGGEVWGYGLLGWIGSCWSRGARRRTTREGSLLSQFSCEG